MHRATALGLMIVLCWSAVCGTNMAVAQCALPNQLINGQIADASEVMANETTLTNCINGVSPAGPTNTIQFNAGSGSPGGAGPLANGQLLIGSGGNAPQAQTLTAGPGISIANGPGSITMTSSGFGRGLYSQVMSATPTSSITGLTTWLNQGSENVSDSPVGVALNAASSGSNANIIGLYKAAPSIPYTIKILLGLTRTSTLYGGGGLGWYDGTSKIHTLNYFINNGGSPALAIDKWNSPTSYNSNDYETPTNAFSQPVWLEISDNGVNVAFAFSQDGWNFITLFSTPKTSGFWVRTAMAT